MRTLFMRTRLWQAILGLSLLSSAPLQAASFVYEGQAALRTHIQAIDGELAELRTLIETRRTGGR